MRIKAFRALRPRPELAELVASVPYDTVNTEEALALADGNPLSFLRVSRPEIDLPPGTEIHSDAVYQKAAENFSKFRMEGILIKEAEPSIYVYRQKMGQHVQTGVVVCCHIEDYENNLIRRHEKTRADKEDDRTKHLQVINANSGPVFLTYRDVEAVDGLVGAIRKKAPLYDFVAPDGTANTVWRVDNAAEIEAELGRIPVAYIADGHHRAASAVRVGVERRSANPKHTGCEEYNWFLAVLFPAGQLSIMPYNRVVKDLAGLTPEAFLEKAGRIFRLTRNAPDRPSASRHAGLYLGGRWHGLEWDVPAGADPVASLDVSVLQDRLLSPVLGIHNPRTDKRIDFVGGIRGTGELMKLVDSGRAAVAFSMYPVTVGQVMAISDAGQIMPPKSTWFEPKLRSGLLVHSLEER